MVPLMVKNVYVITQATSPDEINTITQWADLVVDSGLRPDPSKAANQSLCFDIITYTLSPLYLKPTQLDQKMISKEPDHFDAGLFFWGRKY